MVDAHHGYALVGTWVLSTDNGSRWAARYRAGEPFVYVDAIDDLHAWALTRHSLVATSDGARTWRVMPALPASFTMVHFVDTAVGWSAGGGALYRTTDSGRSWTKQSTPCAVVLTCFSDPAHGWVASSHRIFATTDGGHHWRTTLATGERDDGDVTDLQCTPGDDAWVQLEGVGAAMNQKSHVGYHCTAAVCTAIFSEGYFPEPGVHAREGPGAYPGPFSAIDDHTAVFTGNTSPIPKAMMSTMLFVADGRTASDNMRISTAPEPMSSASGASYTSATNGWILCTVGNLTEIIATADGGHTWRMQYKSSNPVAR